MTCLYTTKKHGEGRRWKEIYCVGVNFSSCTYFFDKSLLEIKTSTNTGLFFCGRMLTFFRAYQLLVLFIVYECNTEHYSVFNFVL